MKLLAVPFGVSTRRLCRWNLAQAFPESFQNFYFSNRERVKSTTLPLLVIMSSIFPNLYYHA